LDLLVDSTCYCEVQGVEYGICHLLVRRLCFHVIHRAVQRR
jgi:hypothetical protein